MPGNRRGAAQRLVVLADHTKWGIIGLSTIVPLVDADVVVTDRHISADARTALLERCDVVVAEPVDTQPLLHQRKTS